MSPFYRRHHSTDDVILLPTASFHPRYYRFIDGITQLAMSPFHRRHHFTEYVVLLPTASFHRRYYRSTDGIISPKILSLYRRQYSTGYILPPTILSLYLGLYQRHQWYHSRRQRRKYLPTAHGRSKRQKTITKDNVFLLLLLRLPLSKKPVKLPEPHNDSIFTFSQYVVLPALPTARPVHRKHMCLPGTTASLATKPRSPNTSSARQLLRRQS